MVDGVAFQNAFSFLEVNFFRDSATCRRCVDQGALKSDPLNCETLKSDVVKCDVFSVRREVLKCEKCEARTCEVLKCEV